MARRLKSVLSLCNRRGFLLKTDSSTREYDYGPNGAALKRNLINEWWQAVVTSTGNVHPIDSSFLTYSNQNEMPPYVLSTSGTIADGSNTIQCSLRSNICNISVVEKCIKAFGQILPFGIAEHGKVFTAPSATTDFPLRQQETENMGVLFLCQSNEDQQWYYHWQKSRLRWWKKLATNPENFSLVETPTSELPEHTLKESYIKYNFPWGAAVVEHITNMGDSQFHIMNEETRAQFKFAKGANGKTYPHQLSLSANIGKGLFAYICDAYNETWRPYGADQGMRKCIVLRLNSCLAPHKVAVLPATDDHRLFTYCRMLTEELRTVGIANKLSTVGAFTYRLALEGEVGTPYHIIVDEKTLETGILTLQDRDTTAMEDMAGRDVLHSLQRMLSAARLNIHSPTFTR